MQPEMPPELAGLLGGGGGGPPPDLAAILQGGGAPPNEDEGGGGLDPLQQVIQMLPGVMSSLPDPRDTQDVARCLQILTGIQTRLMQGGQRGAGPQAAGY